MKSAFNILGQAAWWQVSKPVTKSLGDVRASLMLSFLIDKHRYHSKEGTLLSDEGEDWFFVTSENFEEELCLKYKQQKTVIKILESVGVLVTCRKGAPAKLYFSLCENKILQLVNSSIAEREELELPKGQNNIKNKVTRTYNTPLTPQGGDTSSSSGKSKKQAEADQRKDNAKKSLAFFNEYTGKNLTSKTYTDAFCKALKRGATSEDIAHAIYEQEYSTRADNEKRAKFLTPLTICRPANLARLSDAWRERSKEKQREICLGSSQYQKQANANGLPWKDWPQIVGWKKCTTPGHYFHNTRGEVHYSDMIASRMAKAEYFPNTVQFVA